MPGATVKLSKTGLLFALAAFAFILITMSLVNVYLHLTGIWGAALVLVACFVGVWWLMSDEGGDRETR
jgi:hypothetical protein